VRLSNTRPEAIGFQLYTKAALSYSNNYLWNGFSWARSAPDGDLSSISFGRRTPTTLAVFPDPLRHDLLRLHSDLRTTGADSSLPIHD